MVQNIAKMFPAELIHAASQRIMYSQGNRSGSKIIDKISRENSSVPLLKAIKDNNSQKSRLPVEKTVSLFAQTNLTRSNYYVLKDSLQSIDHKILPGYGKVSFLSFLLYILFY